MASYKDIDKRNKDLEILYTITQAVHKSLDLEEVYNVALDMTLSLENVDMACIYLVDWERKEAILQTHRNLPEDYINVAARIPYPKGVTWKVINTGEFVNIEDIQKDLTAGPAGRKLGHHGVLGIPITLEGKVIGVIYFASYRERQFNKQEVDLLTSIGNQIAIAIAKAKLYRELSKKNRYETIIRTVTQNVHQSINLQEVLENAVEAMSKNIDGVDKVSIYLVEDEVAVLKAYRGYPDSFIKQVGRVPYPKDFTWKAIIEGKPIFCTDVNKDAVIGPSGLEVGTKCFVSMPIRFGDKTVGAIKINSLKKNAFDDEDIKLLEIVAHQIEVAFNNAQKAEVLRQSEERFRALAETANDAIVSADSHGNIIYFNKAAERIFGYSASEVVNKPITFLMPERFHDSHNQGFMRFLSTGEARIIGKTVVLGGQRKDGSEFPVELSLASWETEKGIFFTGILRDITERIDIQETLIQKEKLASLGEMAAGVAHEIRNPLGGIKIAVSSIRRDLSENRFTSDMLGDILSGIEHIENIINGLLDFARETILEKEDHDADRLIREAVDTFHSEISEKGIQVVYNGFKEGIDLYVDGIKIRQVFTNIIKNAIESIKHGEGKIIVNLYGLDSYVTLEFVDNGVGISKENLEKVFHPFFTTKSYGIGLGMAIVKKIVDLHNGDIDIKSAQGEGTKVKIILPAGRYIR